MCVCRQKCALCQEAGDGRGKGPVVQLDTLRRTATCPTCGHCGDRDHNAAMNLRAVLLSLVHEKCHPGYLSMEWMQAYLRQPLT
jgi:transposase